jgi:hypothetical protein
VRRPNYWHVGVRLHGSENLAPCIWLFQIWSGSLSCTQGRVLYRLLVDSAVDLVLVGQVVRGGEWALFAARTVGEEEVEERTPNNQADDGSATCSNGNKAPEQCTERDECQAKDQSELFHETHCLSSQESIPADLFLSLS